MVQWYVPVCILSLSEPYRLLGTPTNTTSPSVNTPLCKLLVTILILVSRSVVFVRPNNWQIVISPVIGQFDLTVMEKEISTADVTMFRHPVFDISICLRLVTPLRLETKWIVTNNGICIRG